MTDRTEELAVRKALTRALASLANDGLGDLLAEASLAEASLADASSPPPDYDEQAAEQLTRALVSIIQDAIDGGDPDKRRLVFEAAVPALLAQGQRPLDLVESHVATFTLLGLRLVEATPGELRAPASRWLAAYFAQHVREVAAIALRTAQGS